MPLKEIQLMNYRNSHSNLNKFMIILMKKQKKLEENLKINQIKKLIKQISKKYKMTWLK